MAVYSMFNYLILLFIFCNVKVYGLSNATSENATSGNDLWLHLARNCKTPTTACIKTTIYDYLKNILDYTNDIQFTSYMKFSKNSVNYQNTLKSTNLTEDVASDETPLEEMSRSLSDDTKKFFITHDLEVQLPDTLFLGSTLKVSPVSSDNNGTMIKLEMVPRGLQDSVGTGRIFFKKIKNPLKLVSQLLFWSNVGKVVWSIAKFVVSSIGKFISEKLLFALLAIVLVIKLLAVKFLFVLPSLVGVVTAKKLIVKVLLFLFPFLHHLFKLCAVTPYGAKHHIHKHQIAHIHQVAPGYHHSKPHYYESPPGHHFSHKDDPGAVEDSVGSASGYENEVYKEPTEEENEVDFWGLGFTATKPKEETKKTMSPTEIENMVLKAEKEALIKSRLQKERQRIHVENLRLQEQLNNALKIQQKLKHHAVIVGHKMKPSKYKHHHFHGPPLLPPPISPLLPPHISPQSHFGPSKLEDPSDYFVENNAEYGLSPPFFGDSKNPQPGPFAEPPTNYVENQHEEEGEIGGGVPVNAIDAVQDYLIQKTPVNSHLYPVFHQNQIEADKHSTPSDFVTVESGQSGISFLPTPTQNVPSKVTANRKYDISSQEEEFYKAAEITYDAFYSPILDKIDAVLKELEFVEEPCKERLICSMYKNPEKFSPHSNLVSSELSRDPKELQKPTSTNSAVIRFYKYVQAARDGQDQRDCLRLYPSCAINTEA